MVEFLKKLRIVALKLLEILSPKLSIYSYLLKFCTVLEVRCDRMRFSVHIQFIEKSIAITLTCINFDLTY